MQWMLHHNEVKASGGRPKVEQPRADQVMTEDWTCSNCSTEYEQKNHNDAYLCITCDKKYCFKCLYVVERYIKNDDVLTVA